MKGKGESEAGGALTLALSVLPRHKPRAEPPGLVTPPLQTMASVPFQWEEAPGRPRPMNSNSSPFRPKSARCLQLPPSLLGEVKVTNMPSPITVFDGPYMGRAGSCCTAEIGLCDGKSEDGVDGPSGPCDRRGGEGNFDFSLRQGGDGDVKVKIARFTRKGSLRSLSHASSNLLERIFEGFKQIVPRRSKKRQAGMRSPSNKDRSNNDEWPKYIIVCK